ncbi:MAG: EF-P lysine aminoacylase EpmA [Candidatus Magasanikbacteria bacterium]
MNHITHIQDNKEHLDARFEIIKKVREFFWSEKFIEVETPNILRLPGQEPYLNPINLLVRDEMNNEHTAYLHTSPEYTMKKMIASGYKNIFSVCKCYRDCESFGGHHNPEFTMIEWYRTGVNMNKIMEDIEDLFDFLAGNINLQKFQISNFKFQKISMRKLWLDELRVNLDEHLDQTSMLRLCKEKGYSPDDTEPYEDLFFRIFLNDIEPKIKGRNLIIHQYPAQMAALAKLSNEDERYAERFEVYVDGIEIANAFTELTDADEQRKRLEEEQERRKKLGKDIFGIDEEFLRAVGQLPSCAGIALGIDRLVMALTGCQNINDVLVLPANKLFGT